DPSGHSWLDWLLPAVGIAFALVGTVASFGALAAPTAALTASYVTAVTTATLSAVSLAADVASIALLATGNENAGRILGFVGMATGLASAAPSIAGAAAKGVSKAGKFVGGWQNKLQNAGGRGRGFPAPRTYQVPTLQSLANNAADPGDVWRATRHMDFPGSADRLSQIAPEAANRYGSTSGRAFNEVRGYYQNANPRVPVVLPANNVPAGQLHIGDAIAPLYANNPDYVREVRMIASDRRARFDYTDLINANIRPENIRTVSREFSNNVANLTQRQRARPRIRELVDHWGEDRTWAAFNDVWSSVYMLLRQ
ncbi:hypothetical protein, partial [Pseudomonas versuta]